MADAVLTPEDDLFWLQRAGQIVGGTADKLDLGARRLADAMAWFWTAYSAVALVTVTTAERAAGATVAIAVAAPSVLIFVAYMSATFAALPIEIRFDDRIPAEIKAAHEAALARRRRRLDVAAALAFVAALAVSAAVMAVVVAQHSDPVGSAVFDLSDDASTILVGGLVADAEQVTIAVAGPAGKSASVVPVVDDRFDATVIVDAPGIHEVTATWAVDEVIHVVSQQIDTRTSDSP